MDSDLCKLVTALCTLSHVPMLGTLLPEPLAASKADSKDQRLQAARTALISNCWDY